MAMWDCDALERAIAGAPVYAKSGQDVSDDENADGVEDGE
jgi:hypothetical protein